MQTHAIRFCQKNEYSLLVNFIRDFWREDHVFVKSKDMLDWQYYNHKEQRYNFVVAYNNETGEFDAILGFIPTSHFDINLLEYNELWLAIWRLKDSASKNVSGLNLLHFLRNSFRPNSIFAIGISAAVEKIYQIFNYDVTTLDHYYIASNQGERSSLASNLVVSLNVEDNDTHYLKAISLEDYQSAIEHLICTNGYAPRKSWQYYVNRYERHPWFDYKFVGIFENDVLLAVIVYRKISVADGSCLRIMDWIGGFPPINISSLIQEALRLQNADYIDFVCKLPDDKPLLNMGFKSKKEDVNIMIPEYFDPLVKNNVDITYAAKTTKQYILVKGDSDQDRPNSL